MRLQGIIKKEFDKGTAYYLVQVPDLLITTDGATESEAYEMARDAVGLLLEDHTKGKVTQENVSIIPNESEAGFDVYCTDTKALVSLVLKQLRGKADMTLMNVSGRIGQNSANAVKQYETGNSEASFAKFQDLVQAMGYDIRISLVKMN